MRCRSVLTRVDALRTGELHADERGAVTEHLKSCPSCDASANDVDSLAGSLKSILPAPPRSCRDTIADSYEQIGEVWVGFSDRVLKMLYRGTYDAFPAAYTSRYCRTRKAGTLAEPLRKQVLGAVAGEGVDKPRIDWSDELSDLEREVLGTLSQIPRGEVRTYEWVARQVGRPKAVRAVGTICAKNVVPFVVPCHPVVPATAPSTCLRSGSASVPAFSLRQ